MAKILIVDDESEIAENLAAFLTSRGHDVSFVCDGAKAEAAAREKRPDLILLDAKLPRIDGFELCRRFKSGPETSRIKIVMMTGLAQSGDIQEALRLGVSDYLVKPFDIETLEEKLLRALASP